MRPLTLAQLLEAHFAALRKEANDGVSDDSDIEMQEEDDDAGWENWDVETDSSEVSSGWEDVSSEGDDFHISDSEDETPKRPSKKAKLGPVEEDEEDGDDAKSVVSIAPSTTTIGTEASLATRKLSSLAQQKVNFKHVEVVVKLTSADPDPCGFCATQRVTSEGR